MNEQLQGKLVEILSSIQGAAKATGDFAMAQLPDVAQSYVMYGRIRTVVVCTVWLLVGLGLLGLSRWAYKNPWNTSTFSFEQGAKRSESNYVVLVFSAVVGGFILLVALLNFDWLVWLAPKVWLLKQLASLVK